MTPVGRTGRPPAGAISLMTNLPDWWTGTDLAFVDHVIDGGYFSVIPGTAFSMPGSVRFSYGSMTLEAIHRLGEHLEQLRRDASGG